MMAAVAACTNTKTTSSEVSHNENDSSTQSVILLINYADQKAQIISCSDSMILVGVGSIGVFDLDSVPLSLDWDKDRVVSRKLNKTDIRILSNISSRLKTIEYFDNSVVLDGIAFNVYLNNKRKVCCYEANLDHIPKEISEIIIQIINIASPLYEVNFGS
jgi:hypothetical protein